MSVSTRQMQMVKNTENLITNLSTLHKTLIPH